jgi:hypothetical protein
VVASVPFLAEEEEAVHPDRWVPLSEGERKEKGYRFGNLAGRAVGCLQCWAERVP